MDELMEMKNRVDDELMLQEDDDAQKCKYMTFKSGNEYFGLKIQYVNEIIQIPSITAIPRTEDYIKGLINLRGQNLHYRRYCKQYNRRIDCRADRRRN